LAALLVYSVDKFFLQQLINFIGDIFDLNLLDSQAHIFIADIIITTLTENILTNWNLIVYKKSCFVVAKFLFS
jgi:hypothetical protein